MIENMSYEQAAQDGPVVTRKLEEMNAAERREIDNLIKRAYVRHGFDEAAAYDRIVQKHCQKAARIMRNPKIKNKELAIEQARMGQRRRDGSFGDPREDFNLPDILHRMEQARRPLSKVAII